MTLLILIRFRPSSLGDGRVSRDFHPRFACMRNCDSDKQGEFLAVGEAGRIRGWVIDCSDDLPS